MPGPRRPPKALPSIPDFHETIFGVDDDKNELVKEVPKVIIVGDSPAEEEADLPMDGGASARRR